MPAQRRDRLISHCPRQAHIEAITTAKLLDDRQLGSDRRRISLTGRVQRLAHRKHGEKILGPGLGGQGLAHLGLGEGASNICRLSFLFRGGPRHRLIITRPPGLDRQPSTYYRRQRQDHRDPPSHRDRRSSLRHELPEPVSRRLRTRLERLALQVTTQVTTQIRRTRISIPTLLSQRAKRDPVQFDRQTSLQLVQTRLPRLRYPGRRLVVQTRQTRARLRRIVLTDPATHLLQTRLAKIRRIKWKLARQQLVQHHSE